MTEKEAKTKWRPINMPPIGTWYHRPKACSDSDKTLWWCYYPHVIDGDEKNGIAVVVDKLPENTQLTRAQTKFNEYVAENEISVIE